MRGVAGLLAALALAVPSAAPAVPPRKAPVAAKAPARADWLNTVTRTADGAFVLGNPAAKVQLVEYLSYTCSHCAAFDAEGGDILRRRYIATGQVRYEVRHAIRDAFDTAAALLAHCEPRRFFPMTRAIFARQEEWLGKAAGYQPDPAAKSDAAALGAITRATGLDAIATAQGVAPARQAVCLASAPMLAQLGAMRQEAWTTRGINGTPAFYINGVDQGVASWAALEPKLAAAVR